MNLDRIMINFAVFEDDNYIENFIESPERALDRGDRLCKIAISSSSV